LKVPPEDMGLVIGKGGTTIKAIRNLIRVRATLEKRGASVILQTD
ncbi:RNA-binding protein, partial [Candidatus Woesebacteria bacterium CG22_combo_CG10-13_8_21_14_all_45_10]